MFSLDVVNVRSFGWVGVEYVGRGRDLLLGNPFLMGIDGDRESVISQYRVWLWEKVKERGEVWHELVRIAKKVAKGEKITE